MCFVLIIFIFAFFLQLVHESSQAVLVTSDTDFLSSMVLWVISQVRHLERLWVTNFNFLILIIVFFIGIRMNSNFELSLQVSFSLHIDNPDKFVIIYIYGFYFFQSWFYKSLGNDFSIFYLIKRSLIDHKAIRLESDFNIRDTLEDICLSFKYFSQLQDFAWVVILDSALWNLRLLLSSFEKLLKLWEGSTHSKRSLVLS